MAVTGKGGFAFKKHHSTEGKFWAVLPSSDDQLSGLPITSFDLGICALLLFLGFFFFSFCLKTPDLVNDSTYPDLAKLLVANHSYQSYSRPETMVPPGFPLVLAFVGMIAGFTPAVFLHLVAMSAALALLASYWLLRQVEGRGLAAVACLLLASSPFMFTSSTQVVFSDMPYFVLSILSLLLALKLDRSKSLRASISWMFLLGVTLVLTIMVRTAGVAMLAGLLCWVPTSLLAGKAVARRRLTRFLLPFAMCASAMLVWTIWANHREFSEWSLPGYPQSYISQLTVKDGNHPELGYAHLSDLPARIRKNLLNWSTGLAVVLSHKQANPSYWPSPAVIGVIGLILIGLSTSLLNGRGQLHDWYFLFYAAMYALWPWGLEMRFLLPLVPLGCLYLWRGAKVLTRFAKQQRRLAGFCFLLAGLILAVFSLRDGGQVKWFYRDFALSCWSVLALLGCALLLRFDRAMRFETGALRSGLPSLAVLAIVLVVSSGIYQQIPIARSNRNFDVRKGDYYASIEAGQWLRSHEPSNAVVMARKRDLVYHYSGDRLVWFPPISDPATLMQGMGKYHIQFVVVTYPSSDGWIPTDHDAFSNLLAAYPSVFHLVHQGPGNLIYSVDSERSNSTASVR